MNARGLLRAAALLSATTVGLGSGLVAAAETRQPTSNEAAANGPIPGDVTLYAKELACQEAIPTPGYYSSLNGAEISDAQRSGLFPCANHVFARRSADHYPGISYINNRRPGELYIVGGEFPTPDDPVPAGPFVAKANATTGAETQTSRAAGSAMPI